MLPELRCLKPLPPEPQFERYARAWTVLTGAANPELYQLLMDLYFRVLDYYQVSCTAMPMHVLSRIMNKRWRSWLVKAGLPDIPLSNLIQMAYASDSLPVVITANKGGGYVLLPKAALDTFRALQLRNAESDVTVEELNEYADVLDGTAAGPYLRGNGLNRAMAPFDGEPENVISE